MSAFYLAAAYSRRAEVARYAEELRVLGHTVTSRWLLSDDERFGVDGGEVVRAVESGDAKWSERCALDDFCDIDDAEIVVAFTGGGRRGGRHVEWGYALASKNDDWPKHMVLIGEPENVFHHCADEQHATWAEYLATVEHEEAAS